MKKIRLMSDYGCYPLWSDDGQEFGDINPFELPINHELAREIVDWGIAYDSILVIDDPASSAFKSVEDEDAFYRKGAELVDRLQKELGDDYIVRGHFPGWSRNRTKGH